MLNDYNKEQHRNISIYNTRNDLIVTLSQLLGKAVTTYRSMAAVVAPDEPRAFLEHHAACRAALAHIHALITLIDVANSGNNLNRKMEHAALIQGLMDEAATALANLASEDE